jgi:membrane-bound serine protease (ClpP class)
VRNARSAARIGTRAFGLLGVAIAVLSLASGAARAQTSGARTVLELRLDGVVDPFTAGYLSDGIARANADGDAAVLITIDTPGGLDSSMREIIQAINGSRVPVICYTSPTGARAASAGTFIMMGCPVAAMAPGTNIGAAHPVGVAGAIEQTKVLNDAAAFISSLARDRGRNWEWARSAVIDSVSTSAEHALAINVVDLIAPDVPSLFADLEGRTVEVAGGATTTLDLTGATIQTEGMGIGASILHALLSPDFAFIFFYLGLGLIVLGFLHHPAAAIVGAILLLATFVTFGVLPVQLIGVVLLLASAVFFLLELKHPGLGLLAVGGTVCLVLGGLTLFNPSVPNARVSPLVIVPTAALMALFFVFVVRAALRVRDRGLATRDADIVGREGTVVSDLAPVGVVQVSSEEWTAEAVRGAPVKGDRVRVVRMDGLRLKVEPVETPVPVAADRGAPAAEGASASARASAPQQGNEGRGS